MTTPFDRLAVGGLDPVDAMIPPVNPFLGLLPKKYWTRQKEFFTYSIEYRANSANGAVALAASAVKQSATVNIDGDSDFLLLMITGLLIGTDDTTTATNTPATIQIQDGSSSQSLSTYPVHWADQVGTGQNPFFLPFPRVFVRNGSITTLLTNLTATARNAYLSFIGFKIYGKDPS